MGTFHWCTNDLSVFFPSFWFLVCSDAENWFCACPSLYSGKLCQFTACERNPCAHGATCVPQTQLEAACLCPYGRQGLLCDEGRSYQGLSVDWDLHQYVTWWSRRGQRVFLLIFVPFWHMFYSIFCAHLRLYHHRWYIEMYSQQFCLTDASRGNTIPIRVAKCSVLATNRYWTLMLSQSSFRGWLPVCIGLQTRFRYIRWPFEVSTGIQV